MKLVREQISYHIFHQPLILSNEIRISIYIYILKVEMKINWVDTILVLHIKVSMNKDSTKELPILKYRFRLIYVRSELRSLQRLKILTDKSQAE